MVAAGGQLWETAGDAINRALTAEAKLAILSNLVRARVFEQAALKQFTWGMLGGWLNMQIGQEGVSAGVQSLLTPADHTISGVRGLGFAIMRGLPMRECYAELMGRRTGCSKGKGGMFSFFSPERNHWGIHGVAAAHTPLAAGLAFAMKQRGERGVAVCMMGDGAMNQGVFHETLNLAGLFSLPVVFVIENNGFGMFTSVRRSSAFKDCLARRAEMYDMAWERCEGHDIYAVRSCVAQALERAREELRPTVLEISTFRYYGATVADANNHKYRTKEEIDWHKQHRDPVDLWNQRLIEEGIAGETTLAEMRDLAKQEAWEAIGWAREQAPPDIGEICEDVYWETDHQTPAAGIGGISLMIEFCGSEGGLPAVRMGSSSEGSALLDDDPLVAAIEEVLVGAFDPLLEEFFRPNLFVKANNHEVLELLVVEKADQLWRRPAARIRRGSEVQGDEKAGGVSQVGESRGHGRPRPCFFRWRDGDVPPPYSRGAGGRALIFPGLGLGNRFRVR